MKFGVTKQLAAGMAALAACAAMDAGAANWAVSTQNVETVSALASEPPPVWRKETGFVMVAAEVGFGAEGGSIVLRLGETNAPGICAVFAKDEMMLATDGETSGDFVLSPGNGAGAYAFRICVRNLAQTTRRVNLEARGANGVFTTVATAEGNAPLDWFASGTVTAGLAGFCEIKNFSVSHVAPGSLFMVR